MLFTLLLTGTIALMVLFLLLFRLRRQRRLRAKPVVISDASVLIAFARVRRLGLLRLVYPVVQTTPTVWREVQHNMRSWPGQQQPVVARWFTGWLIVRRPRNRGVIRQLMMNNPALDRGETEAIALALEIQAQTIVIDEAAGRSQAVALGLTITGTLGVLKDAKAQGVIRAVRPILDAMRATNFHIAEAFYQQFLRSIGE